MKILPVKFNYNKNIRFCSSEPLSSEDWEILRSVLAQPHRYGLDADVLLKTNCLPTLNKDHFEYSDYKTLSPKEKLIIGILNKKRADLSSNLDGRKDLSIKKDAERIFEYASKTKEYLDNKYKNGYRLVGIGNSPAPIVETMQLLGADAITLPFSRIQIEYSPVSRDFPYEHWVPEGDGGNLFPNSYYGHFEKGSAKDWEEYFRFYGVDKDFTQNTGKTLIFSDYVCDGWTKKYIEAILEGIGFDKNYEFIRTERLLPSNINSNCDFNMDTCLDHSAFKNYAKMESVGRVIRKTDVLKHPEYIMSLPENLKSKLFRYALFDLLEKKKKNNSV